MNEAWQGKRFKTDKYKKYEHDVMLLLPKFSPKFGTYSIEILIGISNINQDIDNVLKPFLDILQKKYGFNDRDIFELYIKKEVVNKGKEFISFDLKQFQNKSCTNKI